MRNHLNFILISLLSFLCSCQGKKTNSEFVEPQVISPMKNVHPSVNTDVVLSELDSIKKITVKKDLNTKKDSNHLISGDELKSIIYGTNNQQ